MKNLTEYPTPETDEISAGYIEMADNGQFKYSAVDFARKSRDLERRLAACREFIQDSIDHDHFEAWHIDSARETLTLTAPKP